MNNDEVKRFLVEQLKVMKQLGLETLMKEKRIKELKKILSDMEMDSSLICEYYEKNGGIYQNPIEIPKEYLYELICYIKKSGLEDEYYFIEYCYFQSVLRERGEKILLNVERLMNKNNIRDLSLEQLLNIK